MTSWWWGGFGAVGDDYSGVTGGYDGGDGKQ